MKNEHAGESKGPPSRFAMLVNVLTHVLLLAPVIYIVELGFENYSLFSWHPICMALGAGLLIVEGVYAISGEVYATRKVARKKRVTLHWILHLIGLLLMTAGFVVIVVNKNIHGKSHFVTLHGILGLVTFVLVWAIAGFGVLTNNAQWVYPRVRPVLLKVVHGFAGIGMTVLLLVTLVNGTFNNWWDHIGASVTGRALALAAFAVAAVIVLVKPVIGAVARTRVLMKKPSPSTQLQTNSS
ncbi:cytochrome b561 domain-containing protein 2-like [Copidosoma floridanum]|uniref:cytochrome b561 domain-containing protein 2-like n=1 Tax=Copidosoma floridanum TaxID=29053 RepID=UPI0006C96627|nr:cytochrome b561 domain-containing protein 2-like [Copidosoma floridanum]